LLKSFQNFDASVSAARSTFDYIGVVRQKWWVSFH